MCPKFEPIYLPFVLPPWVPRWTSMELIYEGKLSCLHVTLMVSSNIKMCVTYIADMETSKYKKWPSFHTQPFLMAPNGRHKKMGEFPIYVLMGELLKAVKAVWPKSQVSIVVTSRNKSRVFHFFSATQILITIIVSITTSSPSSSSSPQPSSR